MKRPVLLDLFAGGGGVSAAALRLGFPAICMDLRNGPDQDVCYYKNLRWIKYLIFNELVC